MSLAVETIVNGRWKENCFIVVNEDGDALIVDPGSQSDDIARCVDSSGWRVHAILNTHAHFDHIGAVAELRERYNIPFYLHGGDELLLRRANLYRMIFEARDAIRIPGITQDIAKLPECFTVGPFSVRWLATPGHTDGSVCLLLGNYLFSGDTLMENAVGRTDLPGGNRERLIESVRKLQELPGETIVCGGHGARTTIEAEFAPGRRAWSLLQ